MTFPARYPGKCPACGEGIRIGDELRFSEDQAVHADCADIAPERPAAPVCPECWLEKPCTCEA